jgi:hypothetical protein
MKRVCIAVVVLTVWMASPMKVNAASAESMQPVVAAAVQVHDVSPPSPSAFWMGLATLTAAGLWRSVRHIRKLAFV